MNIKLKKLIYPLSLTLVATATLFVSCTQPTIPESDTLYEVSFNTDGKGENPQSIEVKENTILTKEQLKDIEFKGFTFNGWIDENNNPAVAGEYKVTKNVILKAKWTEWDKVSDITYSLDNETNTLTLTHSLSDASIYYTTDGTEPTANSTKYTNSFDISNVSIVKAISTKDGYNNSNVVSIPIYSITYMDNGEKLNIKPNKFLSSSEVILPETDEFNSWYSDSTLKNEITKIDKGTTEDKTVFLLKPYTIDEAISYITNITAFTNPIDLHVKFSSNEDFSKLAQGLNEQYNETTKNFLLNLFIYTSTNTTTIPENVFVQAKYLEKIIFMNNKAKLTINEGAFAFCPNLIKVEFNKKSNVTSIQSQAFLDDRNDLSKPFNIKIPSTITTIGISPFPINSSVSVDAENNKIVMENNHLCLVNDDQTYSMKGYYGNDTNIIIPAKIKDLTDYPPENKNIETITTAPNSKLKILKTKCFINPLIKKIDLSSSQIEDIPFVLTNHGQLETLILPSSVKNIDQENFRDLPKIKDIQIIGENGIYEVIDDVLYKKNEDSTKTLSFVIPRIFTDNTYIIPKEVSILDTNSINGLFNNLTSNIGTIKVEQNSELKTLKNNSISLTNMKLLDFSNTKLETIQKSGIYIYNNSGDNKVTLKLPNTLSRLEKYAIKSEFPHNLEIEMQWDENYNWKALDGTNQIKDTFFAFKNAVKQGVEMEKVLKN